MDTEAMKVHGAFSWNELMTTDITAAKSFYSELFGWKLKDEDSGDMAYTMASAGDREVAGMMEIPDETKGMPPSWGGYVTVDNVDQQIERARKLGAKTVVEPKDIPNIGRFAVITDPQGAMLTMITYTGEC